MNLYTKNDILTQLFNSHISINYETNILKQFLFFYILTILLIFYHKLKTRGDI